MLAWDAETLKDSEMLAGGCGGPAAPDALLDLENRQSMAGLHFPLHMAHRFPPVTSVNMEAPRARSSKKCSPS